MYILFYANGVVFIASGQITLLFYEKTGLRNMVFYCQAVAIFSGIYIVLVQQKILSFADEESELVFINISIPISLLFLSCAVQVAFTSVI